MKKITKIFIAIIAAAAIWSAAPLVPFYISKDILPPTNETAMEKLKNNEGEYFEFIMFGDNHAGLFFDDSATLKIIARMNREDRFKKVPIDFVMSSGDVTFRGTEWDYRAYNKIRARVKWPVITAFGNHDDDNAGAPRFKEYAGARDFAFSDRNSYFIVLDDSKSDLTEKQFAFLGEELKKSQTYRHRFVIMHKPPFCPYQQEWYRPELSPWAYRFMKLCEGYKVDMVFSGHVHMSKKSSFGGVKYIVSGGGGMTNQIPTPDGGFLHYTVVRVRGDYVDYEVRKVFPPLWEYFAYYVWKDLLYLLKDILI